MKMAIREMKSRVIALFCLATWLATEGQSITIGGEKGVSIIDTPQIIVRQNARYPLWEGVDIAIKSVIDSGISPSLENVLHEIDEMARQNDIKLPYSYSLSGKVTFSTKGSGKTRMGRNSVHRTLTPQNKQRKKDFEDRVAARISNVLRETPPYAGRIIASLEEELSAVLIENLLKDLNKDFNSGSFVLENLSLSHDVGNKYHGNIKITFKCLGTAYPLNSRIEVLDGTSKKSYELNKGDWDFCILKANVLQFLQEDAIRFLKYTAKAEKELSGKDMSAKIKKLSLIPDGRNKYDGYSEIEFKVENDVFIKKQHVGVMCHGKRIEYELETISIK